MTTSDQATVINDEGQIENGTDSADYAQVVSSNTEYYGHGGDDTLEASGGNDSLIGGSGADTFIFNSGDGSESVLDFSDGDRLLFGSGINASNIGFHFSADNSLMVDLRGTSDEIELDGIQSVSQIAAQIAFSNFGTTATVTESDGSGHIFGLDGADVIVPTQAFHTLVGDGGSSYSHTTQDVIQNNYSYVSASFDHDGTTIRDDFNAINFTASDDLIDVTNATVDAAFGANEYQKIVGDVNVKAFDQATLVGGNDQILYNSNFDGIIPVSLSGDGQVMSITSNTDGAPSATLTGGDDYIVAASNQNIDITGDGNVLLGVINGGYFSTGKSELEGGDDTLIVQSAASSTLIGDGDVHSGSVTGVLKGGNDWLEGGSGDDYLVGDGDIHGQDSSAYFQGGNDTLLGGAGNDTLIGDTTNTEVQNYYGNPVVYANYVGGDNLLVGGSGDDTYLFNYFGGQDTVEETLDSPTLDNGNDTVLMRGGLNSISFSAQGDDLLISSATSTSKMVIKDEFNLNNVGMRVENFNIQDYGTLTYLDIAKQVLGSDAPIITGTDTSEFLIGTSTFQNIQGQGGDDYIIGSSLGDTLDGGTGNDTIDAGTGHDSLIGGTGDDTFIINSAGVTVQENVNEGNDTVKIGQNYSDVIFRVQGNNLIGSVNGEDWLTVTNQLASTGATVENFQFSDGTIMTAAAIAAALPPETFNLTGTSSSDSLSGGAGNDTLSGLAGNDTLQGLAGNDSLDGGDGNDILYGGDGNDRLVGGTGNDTLYGGAGRDTYTFTPGFGQDVVNEVGQDSNNVLQFSSGYSGYSSTDAIFTGDSANDLTISFTNSTDQVQIVSGLTAGAIDHMNFLDISYNLPQILSQLQTLGTASSDTLQGSSFAESLSGFAGDDVIYGNDGNDTLDGGVGNDQLFGGTGNDVLNGGGGNDTLSGGLGDDQYTINAAGATIIENANEGTDTAFVNHLQSEMVFRASGNDLIGSVNGVDWLTVKNQLASGSANLENIHFSDGSTVAVSTIVASLTPLQVTGVTLSGGIGNDSLIGGNGNDSISGNAGNDTIYGLAGNDTLNAGDGNDLVYGGDGNDSIIGYNGNDTIDGGLGNDSIDAGAGNDSIIGGGGNDTVYGRTGNDTLIGGDGNDLLDAGEDNDSVVGGLGNDTLIGYTGNDILYGGDGNDSLDGGDGTDLLSGDAGDDSLYGRSGNDVLIGGGGNDLLDAGEDNDAILGGTGNDTLIGYSGNDTLSGGTGNDLLYGDSGNDTFLFAKGDGQDTVFDSSGTDTLSFDSSVTQAAIALFKDSSNHLQIGFTNSSGDQVTLNNVNDIEKLQLANGHYLTNTDVNQVIQAMSSYAANNGIALTNLNSVEQNSHLLAIVNGAWHS